MAKVFFVKRARQDITDKDTGRVIVPKGVSYWYWHTRRREFKQYSLTKPKQSDTTSNTVKQAAFRMREYVNEATINDLDDFIACRDYVVNQLTLIIIAEDYNLHTLEQFKKENIKRIIWREVVNYRELINAIPLDLPLTELIRQLKSIKLTFKY